ncbi:TetR/AcrR family transcriptional regulator [Streptomyces otsuchiensis]|uniref:TetR/AcrR family transcriptional regulator n=1 Tax=Streptomyces otsuchiensis TaxID=2681388 RepID=UPI00102FC372|nr:TetR family transcriptional regulator [Streptomyces otsuchiensis]
MAEHRRQQRDSLLEAARALLASGGTKALTFPALAERTGLARSSVYEYFRSRGAVVEALCATDFPAWAAEVEAAVASAGEPERQLEAYVRTQLALAGDLRHQAVVAIAASELDAAAREQIRAAHGSLIDLVVRVLADLGQSEPRLTAVLLQGVVDAAVRRAGLGVEDREVIAERAVRLVLDGARSAA